MNEVDISLYKTTIDVGAGKLKQILWYYTNIFFFKNSLNVFSGLKVALLRLFGASVGSVVVIKPGVNIKYPWKLSIGSYSWIGESVWIDNLSDIFIGNNVVVSQGSLLLTGSHDHTKKTFDFTSHPIVLEDGVWIGAKAVILGGVTCKTHSILGLGSVAESELKANVIYKGNPAIPVIARIIS